MESLERLLPAQLILPVVVLCVGAAYLVVQASVVLIGLLIAGCVCMALFIGLIFTPSARIVSTYIGGAIVAMVAMPVLRVNHTSTAGHLAYVLVGAIGVVLLLGVARTLKQSERGLGSLWSLVGLLSIGSFATAMHHDHGGWERLGLSFGLLLAVALIAQTATVEDRDRCFRMIVYIAAIEAVIAVIGLVLNLAPIWVGARIFEGGISLPLNGGLLGHPRQQGTLGHPLPLGLLLSIAWVILITSRRLVRHRTVFMVVVVLGILCSMTKSALILLPITYVMFHPRAEGILRAITVAAGTAIVVVVFLVTGSLAEARQNGSYTHRVGAIKSVRALLDQANIEVIFGDGAASEPRLFAAGLLQNDGLQAVDNQYVDVVVQAGVLGFVCLAAAFGLGLFTATSATVAGAMFVVIAESAVFDTITWPSTAILAGLFIGLSNGELRRARAPSAAQRLTFPGLL